MVVEQENLGLADVAGVLVSDIQSSVSCSLIEFFTSRLVVSPGKTGAEIDRMVSLWLVLPLSAYSSSL
ncbi:MAG: hypothetical protein KJ804_16965 [Proteobacteria bacterium]|nr:hypothetical protein [Pseudomonadota bacterium]MBU1060000.1 hypothetical protein [Pseudomonadota bacterium]